MSQASKGGGGGGGDHLSVRTCPMCGEPTKSLGNHLRQCNGGGSA